MVRRAKSDPLGWLSRCFWFWAAPLLFLASSPYLADEDFEALAVLGPFLGILFASLVGFTTTFIKGCPQAGMTFLQVCSQTMFILYAHGFFNFPMPEPFSTSEEQVTFQGIDLQQTGTMSVVLPCLNEPYAFKTVMRFCDRTPPEAGSRRS